MEVVVVGVGVVLPEVGDFMNEDHVIQKAKS
jgi:hypothetical protein